MYIIAALLSIIFTSDNTVYIVTDDNIQSQIIKHEMTRDWFYNVKSPYPKIIQDIAEIQCKLKPLVVIVDSYDRNLSIKYKIPKLNKLPKYRIGEYKEFQEFDPRTFNASGTPIITINIIKNNSEADEHEWNSICRKLTEESKSQYIQNIIIWGQINSITKINSIYFFEEGFSVEDIDTQFKDVIKEYSSNKDFPVYKRPILPDNPVLKFPWEKP